MAKMKNFDDIIQNLSKKLSIEKPKVPQYIEHIYADFVELNALFLKEEVTISDISDLLIDVKDKNIIHLEDLVDNNDKESLTAELNDHTQERIISIFNLCIHRSHIFDSDEYPFELTANQIKIKEHITDKHKIYLFLLISSNLSHFQLVKDVITKEFELLSLISLSYYLPQKSIIKSFGKNSEFKGNAIEKIKKLGEEMSVELNNANIQYISKKNVQERGLDVVAWIPFNDNISNMIIFLGQCACGKDWDNKQNDTSFFSNYFYFEINPIHGMFIPYSLIDATGNFSQKDRILKNLFFDRKRIIEQIENTEFIKELDSIKIIDCFINNRLEIN